MNGHPADAKGLQVLEPVAAGRRMKDMSLIMSEFATEFAAEWIAGWNAHDLDRVLSHYAETVEFYSPFVAQLSGDVSGKVAGKAALREYFAKALAAYPELRFELYTTLVGVRSVTLHYRSVKDLIAAEVMLFGESGLVETVYAHYA